MICPKVRSEAKVAQIVKFKGIKKSTDKQPMNQWMETVLVQNVIHQSLFMFKTSSYKKQTNQKHL